MTVGVTNPGRILALERRGQALELRKAGTSQARIAHALGVTHQAVSKMLHKALGEIKGKQTEDVEAVRTLEVERLNELLFGIWTKARGGDLPALDRVLRIQERRANLLGLDAPKATEISGIQKILVEYAKDWRDPNERSG